MKKYHKIQTIYKRNPDNKKNLLLGQYSKPEFEYLALNNWMFTEKINGTNTRIIYDGNEVKFAGKTDNAQMPVVLFDKLNEVFVKTGIFKQYESPMTLYGESYGKDIERGSGKYLPDNVDFILFDIMIDGYYLKRPDIEDIANHLEIKTVPIVGEGTLFDAVRIVQDGLKSQIADCDAEGLVLKPKIELFNRLGERIITKIKTKDFL